MRPPPTADARPACPKAPSARTCVRAEPTACRTRLCVLSAHPPPSKWRAERIGRGRRKKSIRVKIWKSPISHQPSRAGHCGHAKTNLSVRFNTGAARRIFLTAPHEVPRDWMRFVWQLAARTSEVSSLTTPTRRNSKTRREQLPVTGGACGRWSASCKKRLVRAELRRHLKRAYG